MYLNSPYLMQCFSSEARGEFALRQHVVAPLTMPTGDLAVCDPFVFAAEAQPFSLPLPAGTYPVILTLASRGGDTRVAFARIELSDVRPTSFDLMTLEGQDQSDLAPDEVFGFPVDAGTGCFGDHEAIRELGGLLLGDDHYWERLSAEMEKTYVHTWSAISWELPSGLNVVAFSTGYGDGLYPTYVGLGPDDAIVCVVADLQVLAKR